MLRESDKQEPKSFFQSTWISLRDIYTQNEKLILFLLGFLIILISGLIVLVHINKAREISAWDSYRSAKDIKELKDVLKKYSSTRVAPFILFKICNLLEEKGELDEAIRTCEELVNKFSTDKYLASNLASLKLLKLKQNKEWEETFYKKKLYGATTVAVKTNKGEFKIRLFEDEAPNTVANFISLVEKNFYDGSEVYFKDNPEKFVYLGETKKTLDYTIPFEKNNLIHKEGSVGMIRKIDKDSPNDERKDFLDSASFKFYISLKEAPEADGKFTIFGQVIDGLNVVKQLAVKDKINSISIVYKTKPNYEVKYKLPKSK